MTSKRPVRVIKKSTSPETVKKSAPKEKSPNQSARELVATVAGWVNDFQRKSREETKTALKKVFSNDPQTGEV